MSLNWYGVSYLAGIVFVAPPDLAVRFRAQKPLFPENSGCPPGRSYHTPGAMIVILSVFVQQRGL